MNRTTDNLEDKIWKWKIKPGCFDDTDEIRNYFKNNGIQYTKPLVQLFSYYVLGSVISERSCYQKHFYPLWLQLSSPDIKNMFSFLCVTLGICWNKKANCSPYYWNRQEKRKNEIYCLLKRCLYVQEIPRFLAPII